MRPNIVLQTVGCSNSTIIIRMMQSLGWNLGGIDATYAENMVIARINSDVMRGRPPGKAAAVKSLESLPAPWIIKDPKFCHTLRWWAGAFDPYKPLLLWVTKDHDYVRRSFRRRFNLPETLADQRRQLCQSHYEGWAWGKIKISAEQISAAVRLFDPERSAAHSKRAPDFGKINHCGSIVPGSQTTTADV